MILISSNLIREMTLDEAVEYQKSWRHDPLVRSITSEVEKAEKDLRDIQKKLYVLRQKYAQAKSAAVQGVHTDIRQQCQIKDPFASVHIYEDSKPSREILCVVTGVSNKYLYLETIGSYSPGNVGQQTKYDRESGMADPNTVTNGTRIIRSKCLQRINSMYDDLGRRIEEE